MEAVDKNFRSPKGWRQMKLCSIGLSLLPVHQVENSPQPLIQTEGWESLFNYEMLKL